MMTTLPLVMRIMNVPVFLIGIVLGFGFCVMGGHVISHQEVIKHFKRFSLFDAPETLFYPTIREMRGIVTYKLSKWPNKDAILVVIGGDSIMNGVGQPLTDLWSEHLQELLGDNYCVVNLSMRGCPNTGGGECVAEYFLKNNKRVIYVANIGELGGTVPDGGSTYRYQYWQAYEGDFLLPNPKRLALATTNITSEELTAAQLNEYLRFNEMWSFVTYKHINTVWPGLAYQNWLSPRRLLKDSDDGAVDPVPQRFDRFDRMQEVANTRNYTGNAYQLDQSGHWQENKSFWDGIDASYSELFLPEMRAHTVFVRTRNAPYFRKALTPLELERDALGESGVIRHLGSLGFTVVVPGDNFVDEDFHDRTHLAPSGGVKVAEQMAPAILSLGHHLYGVDLTPAPITTHED